MNELDLLLLLKILVVEDAPELYSCHLLRTILESYVQLVLNQCGEDVSLPDKALGILAGVASQSKALVLKPLKEGDVALHLLGAFPAHKLEKPLVKARCLKLLKKGLSVALQLAVDKLHDHRPRVQLVYIKLRVLMHCGEQLRVG